MKERISSVDLLRVLAIALVVGFHFRYETSLNNSLRVYGFVGMSLFFIISGFMLAKKYPEQDRFSIKWFLKRYIKIASLYYLALVLIAVLFDNQTYSGDLMKNLGLHFIFLNNLSSESAYSFISPAWFLIPMMGLYLLFPFLKWTLKRASWAFAPIFIFSVVYRINNGTLTAFSPAFFLMEFCFGIMMAYNKKNIWLLFSLTAFLVQPVMFLPFLIFYFGHLIPNELFPRKVFHFIGESVFAIFLFHEGVMKLYYDKWHIWQLDKNYALIVFILSAIATVMISRIIQYYVFKTRFFSFDNNIKEKRLKRK